MRAYLQQLIYQIQGSYWFIPSLMLIASIALSQITISIDGSLGSDWSRDLWFTSLNQPEGARALLATVAGSMITVAGVTFSLTILAVSHATSHFGPRLLDNFMRDRGNQITLGTFVATFLYCLLVLRVVRSPGESAAQSPEIGAFVPQLSLFVAFVLAIASVAQLIYFIHHVPDSIHISTVLQRLAKDMDRKFDELYPETIGDGVDDADDKDRQNIKFDRTIVSKCSGYLQGVDDTALMQLAGKHDVVVQLLRRPGDFVRLHEPLAMISSIEDWNEKTADSVRYGFTIGSSRTPTQDVFFILNRYVEVAARALSPGVNDPFTAMQCIDWISVGLVKLAQRRLPSRFRLDDESQLRIITTEVSYEDFIVATVDQLLPYVDGDPNVEAYFRESLDRVVKISENQEINELIGSRIEGSES